MLYGFLMNFEPIIMTKKQSKWTFQFFKEYIILKPSNFEGEGPQTHEQGPHQRYWNFTKPTAVTILLTARCLKRRSLESLVA